MAWLRAVMAGWVLLCAGLLPAGAAAAAPRVAILTSSPAPMGKYLLMGEAAQARGMQIEAHYIERLGDAELSAFVEHADLLVVETPRPGLIEGMLARLGPLWSQRRGARLLVDGRNPVAAGLAPEVARDLPRYLSAGGRANLESAVRLLASRQFHLSDDDNIPPPQAMPAAGYYHPRLPDGVTTDADAALAVSGQPGQPVIGVAIHQTYVAGVDTAYIDTLIDLIEKAGGRALTFYTPMTGESQFARMTAPGGKPLLDVLINNQIMYDATGRREEFTALGVPVLQAIPYRRGDAQTWANDPQGMRLIDLPFYLVQSEIAGSMDPMVVSAIRADTGKVEPILPQVRSVVAKAVSLARLRHLPNADKRVAIMVYNYPPGERNLAASFMNLPQSLAATLAALSAEGYRTEPRDGDRLVTDLGRLLSPFYRDNQLQPLLDADLAAWLPMREYRRWFDAQSPVLREQVRARWGEPERSAMAFRYRGEEGFVIPRLQLGNVAIMPVPPRGERLDDHEAAIYHSTREPVNHFYLAAYLWARTQRDALVHFGTHGTQEWTPGKERGLSVDDQPFAVLGDIPVVYPYIVDDVGEALQAKRRGRATIVSHQTPSFRPAGLHTELNATHDLLHQYLQQDDGGVKDALRRDILRQSEALHLFEDTGWSRARAETDFAAWTDVLHNHLHALAAQLQPYGLHTFGQSKADELRLYTVMMMLGGDFFARVEPADAQELFARDYLSLAQSKPYVMLHRYLVEGENPDGMPDAALRADIERARTFWNSLEASPELGGLLIGLRGGFLPAHTGGDPVRNPDALPTGRNLYGFDPSKIPTRQAWEAGQLATARMLQESFQRNGRYPRKLAYSLWSVETMRHAGILEAQAMAALGVKPKWDEGGRLVGVELIPAQQLGRPRVDVVLSATGLYRDHFPNTMKWLAEAVRLAAAQDEPDNAVRESSLAIRKALQGSHMDERRIASLADTRIFSNESGNYGTGLADATLKSESFADKGAQADARLAGLYLSRMQYAYGPDERDWGQKLDGVNLYAENLKGVDAALLARSSNLYGMLTTDDPFQYLGGIGLAVRHLTGKAPELLISNLRDSGAQRTETAAAFLATELRTRNLHPGWIKGMQAEGYSGALEMLDSLNNFWGWTATSPEIVRDDQWQDFADVYVRDKYRLGMDRWFEQHAPQAQAQMIERMLEAARKQYWHADAATLARLAQRWQNLSRRFDIHSDNAAFREFVAEHGQSSAPAFGLQVAAPAPAAARPQAPAPASPSVPTPPVSGIRLEKVEPVAPPNPSRMWLAGGLVIFLAFSGGALRRYRAAFSNLAASR